MSMRPFVLIGVALAAIVAAGGAAFLWLRDDGSAGPDTPANAWVEAIAGRWQRINPIYASRNDADSDVAALVFSSLVRVGGDGELEPDLAGLPAVSDDGRTYTFELRENARWHDGVPVTARDIAFTIRHLQDPDFRGDPALGEAWSGVELSTPGERTIVIRLRQASAPFVARHATVGILPEHLLAGLSAAELADAPFNLAPVGSGPYRLASLTAGEAVLAANVAYHLGPPKIEEIRLRFFSDDASAIRAASLGEVDGLLVREALTASEVDALRSARGMEITEYQRAASFSLYVNNDLAIFRDERLRRALSLSIDRSAIARSVYPGGATPSSSVIVPGTWPYDAGYEFTRVNLPEARSLLDEAGWLVNEATGVRTREGAELRFTIRTDTDTERVAIAEAVARQFEALNISVKVASTTFGVLQRDFLRTRAYEAAIVGWDQGPDPDPYFAWHSSQQGSAGLNLANFGDIVIDELIARARATHDPEIRKDLYLQFQAKWQQLSPAMVIVYPHYLYLHRASAKGLPTGTLFSASDRFHGVEAWER